VHNIAKPETTTFTDAELQRFVDLMAQDIRQRLFKAETERGVMIESYDEAMRHVAERDALLKEKDAQISLIAESCPHIEYWADCTGTGNADDAYEHGCDMARSVVGDQLRELSKTLPSEALERALAAERKKVMDELNAN